MFPILLFYLVLLLILPLLLFLFLLLSLFLSFHPNHIRWLIFFLLSLHKCIIHKFIIVRNSIMFTCINSSNIFDQFIIYSLFSNFIFTKLLSLLKWLGTGTNLSTSNSFISLFKLLKPLSTFSNLLISNLSASDFKLT